MDNNLEVVHSSLESNPLSHAVTHQVDLVSQNDNANMNSLNEGLQNSHGVPSHDNSSNHLHEQHVMQQHHEANQHMNQHINQHMNQHMNQQQSQQTQHQFLQGSPLDNNDLMHYFQEQHLDQHRNDPQAQIMQQLPQRFPLAYLHHHQLGPNRALDALSAAMPPLPVLPYPNQIPHNLLFQKSPQGYIPISHVPYGISFPTMGMTNFASPLVSTPQQHHTPTIITSNSKTPQVLYRNLFHTLHCKLARDESEWDQCRVYIHENVGYSGNAKRFKRKPDKGEKSLVLECNVLASDGQQAGQCLSCRDYFETQKYYKANPECIGRICLVKNNSPIRVENGQFKILVKMMCCCVHHNVEFFNFQIQLSEPDTNKIIYSAKVPLSVKQWRKSNQKKEECTILLE